MKMLLLIGILLAAFLGVSPEPLNSAEDESSDLSGAKHAVAIIKYAVQLSAVAQSSAQAPYCVGSKEDNVPSEVVASCENSFVTIWVENKKVDGVEYSVGSGGFITSRHILTTDHLLLPYPAMIRDAKIVVYHGSRALKAKVLVHSYVYRLAILTLVDSDYDAIPVTISSEPTIKGSEVYIVGSSPLAQRYQRPGIFSLEPSILKRVVNMSVPSMLKKEINGSVTYLPGYMALIGGAEFGFSGGPGLDENGRLQSITEALSTNNRFTFVIGGTAVLDFIEDVARELRSSDTDSEDAAFLEDALLSALEQGR
ncbi:MAG: trypsin-like peptidase domain-containing protein [Candidatus Sungiibacteriota bacterium]|uniref:Trypsin-like peptidase domain-containing protein n=1 Tax=Candidatus Sungiibacteriota bacterium TaxID=2750080 RepID=A0A7T5RJT6_9BACT|nr:MAG: trypsin-like peptidase domain-containing protein [Candidatus Sungbacteria bacterium]